MFFRSVGWITALHLLVSLFIYDTLLTLVLSAYCGLCVENSQNHEDRVRAIVYGEIFTIVAGLLIYPLETMPHTKEHYWLFQTCCVVVACVSAALMAYSGYNLKVTRPINQDHQLEKFQEVNLNFIILYSSSCSREKLLEKLGKTAGRMRCKCLGKSQRSPASSVSSVLSSSGFYASWPTRTS